MWILAINTATDALGVAITHYENERVKSLAEVLLVASAAEHSERLLPVIDCAVEMAKVRSSDLEGVAVVVGPGGFTGTRTGLAVAKVISQVLVIPVWGVGTLEALAAGFSGSGLVSPLLDARRGDVFAGLYRRSAGVISCEREPELMSVDQWLVQLPPEPVAFIGEGAVRHAAALARHQMAVPLPAEVHVLRPVVVARLAGPHLQNGGQSPLELLPRYHRPPAMGPSWSSGELGQAG